MSHQLLLVVLFLAADPAEPAPDFARLGRPFLERHCLVCHSGNEPKGDLSLAAFRDAESLAKQRKLFERVVQMVSAGEMPPKDRPRPTAAEADAFTAHVKAVFDHSDRHAKPDPGQVTMRRLNRREYTNTVRDLLGVDFNPTEDFPADDVGHGFDNIGDVLTVSPLLMERYLTTAERIAERVITVNLPPPGKRYLAGRYLQPNNASTPQGRFRPLDPTSKDPTASGPFTAAGDYLKLLPDEDLIFRATLYAEPRGESPVKVVLFIAGPNIVDPTPDDQLANLLGIEKQKPLRVLETYEITARDSKKLQTIEYTLKQVPGVQRAGIAVVKPPEGEEPPKLHIENLWSEGPLETRPKSHRMILDASADLSPEERTRRVLTRLLSRGFRRPATPAEVDAFTKLVNQTVADGKSWEAGMQLAVQALLCSPKFLFRVELDSQPTAKEQHPLNEFQLASRLSYFLWSTMPDQELFALANRNELTANLPAQVQRMLRDPKSAELVEAFALQWLQLGKLQTLAPDKQLFPSFGEPLRQAMLTETRMFLTEIVRDDRSLLDLLRADFTYLNEPLARLYGISDTLGNSTSEAKPAQRGQPIRGPGFVRVSLPTGDRGGLLTQASILTVTSNPTRTSPVKRGRWVLEQILGTPPPPPPPNVPELEQQKDKLTGSLRQRMEQHRQNPACANCHAQMDAIGFAFENFDAIGAFRTKDGEFDIDPSGVLPDGRKIQGPADLKQVLLERKDQVSRSLAEKMLTFALGRGLEFYDRRPVDKIVTGVAAKEHKFSQLVLEIVRSEPFCMRRGN